jgi:hypothetical protein
MFKAFDPETVDGGYSGTESGTQKGSGYPLMKVVSLGLSVIF